MTASTKTILAEPEFLSREDTEGGVWTIEECRAVRGEPSTNVVTREMNIPTEDDELARVIRAHEMMHAKVSPAHDWKKWIDRKIASHKAMVAVEELRVNYLCSAVGFDMKNHLSDGSEMADGERIAATGNWGAAVFGAVATAGTLGGKKFLTGIRRHNREWGDILLDISKRAQREIKKANKRRSVTPLASTAIDRSTGLFPAGFSHVERIAEWIDRLADKSPEEIARERQAEKDKRNGKDQGEGDGEKLHTNEGENDVQSNDGNPYKGITPSAEIAIPEWTELRIERLPMPVICKGSIGKRRVASDRGTRPRRIHRMITDPQMRIYDRMVKGSGGVVIIDASGSMSFSREQLVQILDHAPGATVAVYTSSYSHNSNMWIVADKGKMVNELPDVGYGNGVDFPAIEWGHRQRKNSRTPMVWVTDGGVCGDRSPYTDLGAMQCITFCQKNGITVVPHVEDAIAQLRVLSSGGKAKSVWPSMFRNTYRRLHKREID
jgi:hypothetical protein